MSSVFLSKFLSFVRDTKRSFQSSLNSIIEKLTEATKYIESVLDGNESGNSDLGHKFLSIVSKIPQMEPAQVERMMNDNMQDLLMVLYLASLTKTQLSVGSTLNSVIQ